VLTTGLKRQPYRAATCASWFAVTSYLPVK